MLTTSDRTLCSAALSLSAWVAVFTALPRSINRAPREAADKDAEILRQKQERLDWLNSAVETIGKAVTSHELKMLNVKYIREATRRNEPTFIARITRAFEERQASLNAGKENAA